MNFNFRVLPSQLHPVAEAVARFFRDDRGISKFRAEEPAKGNIAYRPTLQASSPEYYDIWVEVSEVPYLQSLDGAVLYCITNAQPVKLYVAFPSGLQTGEYKKHIDEARSKGVGAIEVSQSGCTVIHEAILLSLAGVRGEDRSLFPSRYRSMLSSAEATFRNGDPAKGCSLVYDEIEGLSRRLARKIQSKSWSTKTAAVLPSLNAEKAAWAAVMDALLRETNFNKLPKELNKGLLMQVAALTSVRNDAGHKPKNRAARVKRDRELRTRFESAVDVLRDFANAARPLRI